MAMLVLVPATTSNSVMPRDPLLPRSESESDQDQQEFRKGDKKEEVGKQPHR